MPKRTKTSRKTRAYEFDDTPEYLAEWSAKLAEALTTDELRLLARDYGRFARNQKLSARDRQIARRREKAIRRILSKHR